MNNHSEDKESLCFQARIIESVQDAVIGSDTQYRICLWNAAAETIFGWRAGEVLGKLVQEVIPVHRYLSGISRMEAEQYLQAEGSWKGDVVQHHREGHEVIVEASVLLMRDEQGLPSSIVTISRDIAARLQVEQEAHTQLEQRVHERTRDLAQVNTALSAEISERQRIETSLRDSEQRFRSLLDLAPDGIALFDQQGICLQANVRAADLMGYTLNDLHGMPLREFVTPEEILSRALPSPDLPIGASSTGERMLLRKDGSTFPAEISSVILPGHMMQSIFRDITTRTAASEQLRQAKAEADAANQAKSEFLSRMSHELRTPLNAILGFAQLLEMDGPTPREQESVDQILRGGRHLLTLINEVLDITSVESGRLSISPEPIVISDVVAEAIALLGSIAAQYGVTVNADYVQNCHRHVLGDQQRFKQVLLNLLANAIKYNRTGGSVHVTCEAAPGDRLRLEIRDTGHGIPAEKFLRLFTPFDRLDAEQTTIEGTGLGLALSKRLMEAMGGSIGVQSVVGTGSTFWIELPLVPAPSDHTAGLLVLAPANLLVPFPPVQPSRTLLYIEDDLTNVRLIERVLLHRPEIALLPALQGRLGLELAREHSPDLIILDLHLPDIQGDEVLRQLRADIATHKTPVIMLSAETNPRRREELLTAGATGYLTKPLDVRQFLAVVDDTLESIPVKRH